MSSLLGISAMLSAVLSLFGCQASNSTLPDRAAIEEAMRIRIPDAAEDLHYREDSGIDWIGQLRFRIPPGELEEFLKSAGYDKPLQAGRRFFYSSPAIEWWDPDSAKTVLGGDWSLEHSWASQIIVDTSKSEYLTVYLQTFQL